VQALVDGHVPERRRLTEREREIARAVAHGSTADEVAAQLCLSRRTVETHLASVYRKCDVRNRKELREFVTADPAALE